MNDDEPKTAVELAMERLRQKDAASGVEDRTISNAEKDEIAEVKRVYAARQAEAEILYKSKVMAVWEPEERAKLEQGHRRDLERLREEQEKKLQKIRDGR